MDCDAGGNVGTKEEDCRRDSHFPFASCPLTRRMYRQLGFEH